MCRCLERRTESSAYRLSSLFPKKTPDIPVLSISHVIPKDPAMAKVTLTARNSIPEGSVRSRRGW